MVDDTPEPTLRDVRAALRRAEHELSNALRRVEDLRAAEAALVALDAPGGPFRDTEEPSLTELTDSRDLDVRIARVILDLAAALNERTSTRPRTSDGIRQILVESAEPVSTARLVAEFARRGWLDRHLSSPRAAIHQAAVRLAQSDPSVRRIAPGLFEAVTDESDVAP